MNWAQLLLAVQEMDPVVAVMATVMFGFFAYKGGIKIFPKLQKKEKPVKLNDATLQSLHLNCPNYGSFQIILERVMEKSDKIFRVRYQDTIYEQMNEAEMMWSRVVDILTAHFGKVFDELNPDAKKADRIFMIASYVMIMNSIEVEIIGTIRRYMRKNHFLDKNEVDYGAYIQEKTNLLYDKTMKLFDRAYDEDRLMVDREVLRQDLIDHCMPEITRLVREFFLKAKVISLEKQELIVQLESEIAKI